MRDLTQGITVRGRPLNQSYPGRVFYVSNTTTTTQIPEKGLAGSDANGRGSYLRPFATIDFAVGQCKANRGDVILVMPGHAETYTLVGTAIKGLTLDVAGIAIIGLGAGTSRPTITMGSSTGDEALSIAVSAANISLKNFLFTTAGTLDMVTCFLLAAAKEFNIEGCEFREATSILNWLSVVKTSAVANAADGLRFADNRVLVLNTTPLAVINVLGTMSRLELTNNFVNSASTDIAAGGEFLTTAALVQTDVLIDGNVFLPVGNASKSTGIFMTSTGTIANQGTVSNNLISSLDTGTEIISTVGTSYGWARNFYTGVADKSGYGLPTLDA